MPVDERERAIEMGLIDKNDTMKLEALFGGIKPSYTYGLKNNATVTTDVIVPISLKSGIRILSIKRKNDPFKGMFALPGGILDDNEEIIDCAIRELYEETNLQLKVKDLSFLNTYSKAGRDPRGRYISFVFLYNKFLREEDLTNLQAKDDAESLHYVSLEDDLYKIYAFDHGQMIVEAIRKIRLGKTLHYD